MAAVIPRGSNLLSTPLSSVQEKGSRNKRKFRADPPVPDLNKLVIPQTDCPYEIPTKCHTENHACGCESCSILVNHSREDPDIEEPDWDDCSEAQLEELLLKNLDAIFKNAIKRIASDGYSEEIASKAVLRSGLCYGPKDTISNIVDNTLKLLKSGAEVDYSSRDHFFEDLQQLEKYILAEMVCVLREVRPFFSTGDAMWCLLICDLNVSHACAMDGDPLSSLHGDEIRDCSSEIQPKQDPNPNSTVVASPANMDFNAPKPESAKPVSSCHQHASQPELPMVSGIPNLPSGRFSASRNIQGATSATNTAGGKVGISSGHVTEDSSSSSSLILPLEKHMVSKKGHGGASKRESILRQKLGHYDKSYRAHGSKGNLKTSKPSGLASPFLDKKGKSISNSTITNLKNAPMKLSEAVGLDIPRADDTQNISFSAGVSTSYTYCPETHQSASPLPTANTELSLSLPSSTSNRIAHRSNSGVEMDNCNSFHGLPSELCGAWIPQDKKDEMLAKLVPRVRDLQAQLQEWTVWAQEKVMQAARRLSKEKSELHSLRQEREDAIRLKNERKSLEDATLKKLSEIEIALTKAGEQVGRANTSVHTLESENANLRYDMQAAKLQAAESSTSCQKVSRREVKTLKNFQSWDRQKALLQEELLTEKRKVSQLHQEVMQAKEYQEQLEARWKQEEKVKIEALKQADTVREERELLETSARSKEDAIKCETEGSLLEYKEDIRKLESQIAQLRFKTDSSKIAALRWSIDGKKRSDAPKGGHAHPMMTDVDVQDSASGDVQRERECVMCLCDEMSVVFLPCAHQVVCTKCNELHEKQGMKDCPSCRTPIQLRVSVRFRNS